MLKIHLNKKIIIKDIISIYLHINYLSINFYINIILS